MSFGHPGFAALEFAGCCDAGKAPAKLTLRGKSIAASVEKGKRESADSDGAATGPPPEVGETEPACLIPSPPQGLSIKQRLRGTFINHTPREFEVSSPRKSESRYSPPEMEMSSRRHTDNTEPSADRVQRCAPENADNLESPKPKESAWRGSAGVEGLGKNYGLVEDPPRLSLSGDLNLTHNERTSTLLFEETQQKESVSGRFTPQRQSSTQSSVKTPLADNAHRSKCLDTSDAIAIQDIKYPQNTAKRRRRQTPFKIPALKYSIDTRHSPLEPWVAYHRREASFPDSFMTTSGPPRDATVDVTDDEVGKLSASRAIQEYFAGQSPAAPSAISPECDTMSRPTSVVNVALECDKAPLEGKHDEKESVVGPDEPVPEFPIEDWAIPRTPSLPGRNPKRLDSACPLQYGSFSSASGSMEAGLTAYSYSEEGQLAVPKRNHRNAKFPSATLAANAGSGNIGRMAPPILGHEAVKATADLNDLSYYLKHTGPSPEPQERGSEKLRKPSLKVFKVRGGGRKRKNSLAARVGSVEGSPNSQKKHAAVRRTPACAKEMTTSSGTKHLRIVIPSHDALQEQLLGSPVELDGNEAKVEQCQERVSFQWTEEILNPLASAAVEKVISGLDDSDSEQTAVGRASTSHSGGPVKSPKRERISVERVPVEEHPLLTRQDRTRARKLRDLRRSKTAKGRANGEKKSEVLDDGASATAHSPLPRDPSPVGTSTTGSAKYTEGEQSDHALTEVALLKKRVVSLQRQNTALTEALAKIVGFEAEEGDLDSDAVLRAYRQIKTGSGDSGYGYAQRGGRVFTA